MKALPLFGRLSLLAALSATPACFAPAFVPRIDLGGSGPDPHTTYTAIELDDGTTVKVGVETGGKDYRPWIARFGADEKPVWQRTFARMGQGGNAIITSAAVLADGSIAAALADKSVTTLAMVAVEPDGHLRWALELDLPERAEARARILPTHDGALALVPVHGDGDARIVVVRTDLQGKVLWSYSYGPLVDVTAATWSETSGLTFTGHDLRPREPWAVATRVSPSGEAMWMLGLGADTGEDYAPSLSAGPDGRALLTTSWRCPGCDNPAVSAAMFDAQGGLVWRTMVIRPSAPPAPDHDRDRPPHPWPASLTVQVGAPMDNGGAIVACTVPSAQSQQFHLAVLRLAADGSVVRQRAFEGWPALPQRVTVADGLVVVTGKQRTRCTLGPGREVSCGEGELSSSLISRAESMEVVPLVPVRDELHGATRDLREELSRTMK
ncbi:MAG: hypothetical protein R3B70_05200 [Polyangiaceae bacterium]